MCSRSSKSRSGLSARTSFSWALAKGAPSICGWARAWCADPIDASRAASARLAGPDRPACGIDALAPRHRCADALHAVDMRELVPDEILVVLHARHPKN